MSDPLFRFSMRAAVADPTGYYVTRWDRAQKMTVIGATQDEAVDKAAKMLGNPDRGRCWSFRFDGSDEILPTTPQPQGDGCCCGETDDAWRLCPVHGPKSPAEQEDKGDE